jgi:hypothetical protein
MARRTLDAGYARPVSGHSKSSGIKHKAVLAEGPPAIEFSCLPWTRLELDGHGAAMDRILTALEADARAIGPVVSFDDETLRVDALFQADDRRQRGRGRPRGSPVTERSQPQLSEVELAQALEYAYGTTPGHAAEIAAWHFGHGARCMPDDAYPAVDIETVWKRS